jgi:hypothetical protein
MLWNRNSAVSTLAFAMLIVAAPAWAQSTRPIALFAGVELAHITEDEGVLGKGPGTYGGITIGLGRSTSLAVEAGVQRHVRDFTFGIGLPGSFFPAEYRVRWLGTATYLMLDIRRSFGDHATKPFVYGGIGMVHDGGTRHRILDRSQVPPEVVLPEERFTGSGPVTAWGYEGGGGLDIRVNDRVGLRPFSGIRLMTTGETGPKFIIHGGMALTVRMTAR